MKGAKIGIYKSRTHYFAIGATEIYKMQEIKSDDKHTLAFGIRDRLNDRGIRYISLRPFKNGRDDFQPVSESELESIAISMNVNTNNKKLNVTTNKRIYVKK